MYRSAAIRDPGMIRGDKQSRARQKRLRRRRRSRLRQSVHTRAPRLAQCDGRNAQFPAENEQEETHKRWEGGSNSHLSHTFCRPLPIGNVLLTATATIEVPYYGRWLYRHSRFLGVQKVPMKSESSQASFLLKRTVDVTP